MHRGRPSCLARGIAAGAFAFGLGLGGSWLGLSHAWACGRDGGCVGVGYRPHPGYSAPAVYSYVNPAALYGVPGYVPRRHSRTRWGRGPIYIITPYTTRLNIFRGPRWNYSAATYTSPTYRSPCRRARACGHGGWRVHRAPRLAGPFVRVIGGSRRR